MIQGDSPHVPTIVAPHFLSKTPRSDVLMHVGGRWGKLTNLVKHVGVFDGWKRGEKQETKKHALWRWQQTKFETFFLQLA